MKARGFIVAAPCSGSGKTTVTLGILAALRRRGVSVRAAKSGPDYIDAAFHTAACGVPSINLDSWAMPPPLLDALLAEAARDADMLLIEGAMGLFDGATGSPGRSGATADLAIRYRLPVLLVVDVSAQAQSAAAVVRGFASHAPGVRICGVVFNRLGGERHRALVSNAVADMGVAVFGGIARDEALCVEERHLGLVQAVEHADLAARLARLGDMAERHINLDAVLAAAAPIAPLTAADVPALPPPGQRIALAADPAFSFVYAHHVNHWRRAGAETICFSPLADEPPPESCDVCWLPGGYPELHAGRLTAARRFRDGLTAFAATRPVHGECGGYMVLGEGIEDADGARHAMTGLLGHATSFAKRRLQLGYREARLLAASPIGPAGCVVRGHEFHYATLLGTPADEPLADLVDSRGDALGMAGSRRGLVTGTFFHAIAHAERS
jgi:cobyrinic acid a,c-diamide synthase